MPINKLNVYYNACDVASKFSAISQEMLHDQIRQQTLNYVQKTLAQRIKGVS